MLWCKWQGSAVKQINKDNGRIDHTKHIKLEIIKLLTNKDHKYNIHYMKWTHGFSSTNRNIEQTTIELKYTEHVTSAENLGTRSVPEYFC